MTQLSYTTDPEVGVAGQIARGSDFRDIVTGVAAEEGQPEITDIVFAGTWAPNDDVACTIMGISVPTTNIVGATPTAARNEHLATLLANADVQAVAICEAISTDTLRITSREIGETGRYFNLHPTAGETTAGDGTAVATTTQQEAPAALVEFGMGLALDTTDDRGKRVVVPTATAFIFAGVSVMTHAEDNRTLPGDEAIAPTKSINLLKKGYIYLVCEDGCDPGDPVYLRHTVNGANTPGHFRTDADTARADAITGARWVTGAAAGGLAVAYFG
jgi:hypothetical protein